MNGFVEWNVDIIGEVVLNEVVFIVSEDTVECSGVVVVREANSTDC